jgi:ankyrin repeat protein
LGTALQEASARGCEAIVRFLVENRADVNAPGGYKWSSALVAAAYRGSEPIVRYLVENGADVKAQGDDALSIARIAKTGNFYVNGDNVWPRHYTAVIAYLLKKGARIKPGNDNETLVRDIEV